MSDNLIRSNNKLCVCKCGYPNMLILTYIDDHKSHEEPLSTTELSKYLKAIYSKNEDNFIIHNIKLGENQASEFYRQIIDELGEPYQYKETKKQEENNINKEIIIKKEKIPIKDNDGKNKKDESNHILYEKDENGVVQTIEKEVEHKTFKKLLYDEFCLYYKDDIIINCAKIYGYGLNANTFVSRINKEFNTSYKIEGNDEMPKKPKVFKEKENKDTKVVSIKGKNKKNKNEEEDNENQKSNIKGKNKNEEKDNESQKLNTKGKNKKNKNEEENEIKKTVKGKNKNIQKELSENDENNEIKPIVKGKNKHKNLQEESSEDEEDNNYISSDDEVEDDDENYDTQNNF